MSARRSLAVHIGIYASAVISPLAITSALLDQPQHLRYVSAVIALAWLVTSNILCWSTLQQKGNFAIFVGSWTLSLGALIVVLTRASDPGVWESILAPFLAGGVMVLIAAIIFHKDRAA